MVDTEISSYKLERQKSFVNPSRHNYTSHYTYCSYNQGLIHINTC